MTVLFPKLSILKLSIMRRILSFVIVLMLALPSLQSYAQNITVMGPRLLVNSPAGISGLKKFTYSSSSATGTWGRVLDSFWSNVELVRSQDSLGCTQPIAANYANKWVIIWRGNCQFGEKAKAAQDRGAAGVIIINNVPGADPVGMAAGTAGGAVVIPVLMVSNPDGAAIWSTLGSQQVFISLTRWGFNNTNDLAIVPKSGAIGPGSIPLSQWKSGSPTAYKFYSGAFIANTGTANQTNVKVSSVVTFTPTGGSSTVVYTDSAIIPTLNAADSILEGISPRSTSLNPTQTGRYTIKYAISYDNTDQNPADDTASYYVDVTTNVFCKGRLDATGKPIVTGGTRVGSTPPPAFVWGPLFYMSSSDTFKLQAVQFAISDGDTSRHSLSGSAVAYVMKWTDGSNTGSGGKADNIIQPAELQVKGAALREFTTADSNNQVFTAYIGKEDGTAGTILSEPNSWYWVVADMPGNTFLGTDGELNYYNRTNAAKYATTAVADYWSPIFISTKADMLLNSADSARMIPFGVSNINGHNIDSASFTGTSGTIPAMALVISPFKVSVNNVNTAGNKFELFPNPATSEVNVKFELDKKADKAQIRVIDVFGKNIQTIDKANIQNETIRISTSNLASGNYYVVVIANGLATVKPFTVNNK
ncbi:hypothetical protein CAP35_04505 [Chitinophagaceae bacterium IBVUCB1]|nr:hypothetical protein CAP35_04505 [Chitinophagaceae bacterium IBVUCB1]